KLLCGRFGIGNLATLLTSQLVARPVVVQMLEFARGGGRSAREASISYIILSRLERALGYSSVPWIAELERLLPKNGRLDDFRQLVATATEADGHRQEWESVKHNDFLAQPLLVQGLQQLMPRTYKTEAAALDAVRCRIDRWRRQPIHQMATFFRKR